MIPTRIEEPNERISQGDIFKDIEYIEYYLEKDGNIELSKIVFPYIFVLTQDCDLAQDFFLRGKNQDKILISVLVAPMYNLEFVMDGSHLSELEIKMHKFKGTSNTAINDISENNNPRYHHLNFGNKMPEFIIDFKHYFTLNRPYLESITKTNRLFKVKELHREQVCQRFSSFLSRIGLPD